MATNKLESGPPMGKFHLSFTVQSLPLTQTSSTTTSPRIQRQHFRPQISSAMPAINDDIESLDNLTLGDDEVLVMDDEGKSPSKSSKFFMRFWSWLQSKYKMGIWRTGRSSMGASPKTGRRERSIEFHTRKIFNTKVDNDEARKKEEIILNKWRRAHSSETLTRSWADVCISNAIMVATNTCTSSSLQVRHPGMRRSSYMPTSAAMKQPPPERFRTGSLVPPNQHQLLHPLSGSKREFSLESGYLSHEGSNSTPNSPKKFIQQQPNRNKRGAIMTPSISEDDGSCLEVVVPKTSKLEEAKHGAREKRQLFLKNSVFHEVIEDEDVSLSTNEDMLGEWEINHEELYFGKRLVDSRRHQIFQGKWHGDIIIHLFKAAQSDKKASEAYYDKVKALMHIRHENIVLFMGASVFSACQEDLKDKIQSHAIITNYIKAESLYSRLNTSAAGMFVTTKMSIACQVANALGYLHAKNITHGRLCSRNIFLESKVQLSLLDYAIGHPNYVYSSPQLLEDPENPRKADDIFAFGSLIFEIFAGKLPFNGSNSVALREIPNDRINLLLQSFPCTEKLKRIIQACWQFEGSNRLPISQLIHNFQPGSCLVRRHSTSEPRLDQLNLKR